MAEHTPVYLNGTVLSEVTCLWPHLFQARQFQGKGEFKFDTTILLTPEQHAGLKPSIEGLAVSGFKNNEYNRTGALEIEGVAPPPAFKWPYTPVLGKPDSPKLAELFPGHFVMSASAFVDRPPEILIPNAANPGTYMPMPEGQRAQLVYDGATCWAGVDFATYVSGPNVGIRAQLNFIVFNGTGEKVSVGARVDAVHALAGVQITMQTPVGMVQAGAAAQPQVGGMVTQGVVQQAAPAQAVTQQAAPAQAVTQQAAPAQVVTQQAAPVQTAPAPQQYALPDGTPCDAAGNPLGPQVDFTT